MTKTLANQLSVSSARCTIAVLEAFGIRDTVPYFGSGVLEALKKHGFSVTRIPAVERMTLHHFKEVLDKKKSYKITTRGHALAVIEGHLIDTALGGWNRRRIEFCWEVERDEAKI